MLQHILGKTLLVMSLNGHKLSLGLLIIRINCQLLQLGQVGKPLISDMGGNPLCQLRIGMVNPSSLGNTVCFVGEFLRIHLVEVS